MRVLTIFLVAAAIAACGDDDDEQRQVATVAQGTATATPTSTPAAAPAEAETAAAAGTRITARGSEFGTMLWGSNRRAIYIFERDRRGRSRCYGACAEAWPPVYTKGKPVAGRGVRKGLLGTTRRRNGRRQVTYNGKPLYYYAHEGAGEVRCHDVNLNGGFWWVIGPGGDRRP